MFLVGVDGVVMSFNSSDTRGSLYGLVDEHASGILVSWIKYARATGDYGILDEYCETAVSTFLVIFK